MKKTQTLFEKTTNPTCSTCRYFLAPNYEPPCSRCIRGTKNNSTAKDLWECITVEEEWLRAMQKVIAEFF